MKSPSQAVRSARPHPFAASADTLTDTLDELLGEMPRGESGETTLLLPSLRSAPLDSPRLLRPSPRPTPRSAPELLAWTVPVVTLPPSTALAALTEGTTQVRRGASLDYLGEIAQLATELVREGRVIPAVKVREGHAHACWRPKLEGHDVVLLHSLALAMPPVCRAVPGQDDPTELATTVLSALVDAAARRRLEDGVQLTPPRRGRRPRVLPALEAWLTALTASDAEFQAEPTDTAALAEALTPWDGIGRGTAGLARASFRLVEPGAESLSEDEPLLDEPDVSGDTTDGWRLEFLLQASADPSLLVPAQQIWEDDGGLDRWLPRPQELLLSELGRASRLFPDLAAGLRQAQPRWLELDAEGAFGFLTTVAPALDEAGFGVLLPNWWDHHRALGLQLSASTPVDGVVTKTAKFGKDQLMDFRWDLAVGGEALTADEIAVLAATKAPLIRLRGQWVAIDPDQIKRGLAFLKQKRKKQMTAAEILALALTHPDDSELPLPVMSVRSEGWLGDLLDGSLGAAIQPVSPPDGLNATLRPYQLRGVAWLAFLDSVGLGACLADDMGLGKTIQLLALELTRRSEEPDLGPTLLLCPMSLVGNWQREAAKFTPALRVYAHHGRERLSGDDLRDHLSSTDLVVTTYATATRDIDELSEIEWDRVVLDEAQAIKNSLSRSAKAANQLTARSRVALTGTPVENRLAEMWSILSFVNPGSLGSPEQFRTRYAIPIERHGATEPAERLRAITRPYILRRLKTDPTIIDDLPEKIEIKQHCQLTAEQASLYQAVVDEMMERIEGTKGIERRGNVLAAMTKLKQVCNHPALLLHDRSSIGTRSGKVNRLEEILDELLAEGDRALCFTQYTEFAEMMLPHLAARLSTDVAYLHGGTSKKRRDELVTDFQSGDGPPIFLLSLKAGGTGLNLTAANHVIHLDRWWNPAVENQATDRAFRIGQHRTVQVRKFITTGTLEEKIDEMIEEKKALADLVVRDGESWLTELSARDLREVFTLSAGAVDE
ncbi:MAG: DEAD/DEAH box helicase [Nocardioides sp.]|uniref:DEAD/DEAH box helicase n=1 Tax=Nocardioides sp. TaxID=35761 RepID=UPI0039E68D17